MEKLKDSVEPVTSLAAEMKKLARISAEEIAKKERILREQKWAEEQRQAEIQEAEENSIVEKSFPEYVEQILVSAKAGKFNHTFDLTGFEYSLRQKMKDKFRENGFVVKEDDYERPSSGLDSWGYSHNHQIVSWT